MVVFTGKRMESRWAKAHAASEAMTKMDFMFSVLLDERKITAKRKVVL